MFRNIQINFLSVYLISFLIAQPVFAEQQRPLSATTVPPFFQGRNIESLDQSSAPTNSPQMIQSAPEGLENLGPQINIHILGEVLRPGIYRTPVSSRMSSVLSWAGLKRESTRIVQVKQSDGKTRQYDLYRYYYHGDLSQNPFLGENDVVFIPPLKGAIRIEGPVARPGVYEIYRETNVYDTLLLSGGVTNSVSNIHPIKIIRFSEGGKKFILNVQNIKSSLKSQKVLKGDIIIVPDIINNPKKFDYSVESIPGEKLFYPTSTPNVFVMGQVTQAASYPYKSQLRVKDYIAYASPSPSALLKNVTLIRDGKRSLLRFDEKPIPGDILVVKSKISVGSIVTVATSALTLTLTILLLKDQLEK